MKKQLHPWHLFARKASIIKMLCYALWCVVQAFARWLPAGAFAVHFLNKYRIQPILSFSHCVLHFSLVFIHFVATNPFWYLGLKLRTHAWLCNHSYLPISFEIVWAKKLKTCRCSVYKYIWWAELFRNGMRMTMHLISPLAFMKAIRLDVFTTSTVSQLHMCIDTRTWCVNAEATHMPQRAETREE